MAETRKLELMARDGRSFTVMVNMETSGPSDRFTIRFAREPLGVFTDDDMDDLVEFIGYPHESADRADRLQKILSARDEAYTALVGHAERLQGELDRARENVRVLVESLEGAWWLDAASSYRALAAWLGQQ